MRKLFLTLLFILLFSVNAMAAIYYVDYALGADVNAGDAWGAGNAWKTIEHALNAGDEVRIAKSAETALTGTLTWTDGSATVSTSQDITAEVAPGDFIKKDTETIWWEISAEAAGSLTLVTKFYGTGGAGASSIIAPFLTGGVAENDVASSGTDSSPIVFEGGYNTTSGLVDGVSFYDGQNDTGFGFDDRKNYIEAKNLIFARYDRGALIYKIYGTKLIDCQFVSNASWGVYFDEAYYVETDNLKMIEKGYYVQNSGWHNNKGLTEIYGGTYNINIGSSSASIIFEELRNKNASSYGIQSRGASIKINKSEFDDNVTADIRNIYANTMVMIDTKLDSTTPISTDRGRNLYVTRLGQITDNHYIWKDMGDIRSTGAGLADTTVKTGGNHGIRFAPTKAEYSPLEIRISIPVISGQAVTIDGYLYMNATYQGDANKTLPKITLSGCGITEDTDSMADTATTWLAVQVTGTPTRSGSAILTISTAANDAASYAYADEFSITDGAGSTDGTFDFWSELNGQPAGLIKGGGAGGSYGCVY